MKKRNKKQTTSSRIIQIVTLVFIFLIIGLYLINFYFFDGYGLKGFNKYGYDVNGFDKSGYDQNGFDWGGYDKSGFDSRGYDRQGNNKNPTNDETVRKIAEEYHRTHTYDLPSFFVCGDMALDVWNLIKTQGINAIICAGNVDENIFEETTTKMSLEKTNHVWVLAETAPLKYTAVETTGGYLIHDENKLYYRGFCFENPAKFKRFQKLREDFFQICGESEQLIDYWNENIAGRTQTYDSSEFKGRMDTKQQECNKVTSELRGLIT